MKRIRQKNRVNNIIKQNICFIILLLFTSNILMASGNVDATWYILKNDYFSFFVPIKKGYDLSLKKTSKPQYTQTVWEGTLTNLANKSNPLYVYIGIFNIDGVDFNCNDYEKAFKLMHSRETQISYYGICKKSLYIGELHTVNDIKSMTSLTYTFDVSLYKGCYLTVGVVFSDNFPHLNRFKSRETLFSILDGKRPYWEIKEGF